MVMRVVVLVVGGWLAFVSSLPVLAQMPDDFVSTSSPSSPGDMLDDAMAGDPMGESEMSDLTPPPPR